MTLATPQDWNRPLLLQADNFTPLTRTPWAGKAIGRDYKAGVVPQAVGQRIGESWEISCDPTFPSAVLGQDLNLPALCEKFPTQMLSSRLADHGVRTCEVLVKLLNPASPLSLQVHPEDDDPHLQSGECGKPESWYVLAAEPNAGLFLGFSKALSEAELIAKLRTPTTGAEFLQFVPVKPGDYFEIGPGVPHAIGPGVVLLEPQRIRAKLSGKTYRMWDWGRRYNEQGELDQDKGMPRELHVEAALRLVDSETQVGMEFVDSLRRPAETSEDHGGLSLTSFPDNGHYQVRLLSATKPGGLEIKLSGGYGALVVLQGDTHLNDVKLPAGQPAFLPGGAQIFQGQRSANFQAALVTPAGTRESIGSGQPGA